MRIGLLENSLKMVIIRRNQGYGIGVSKGLQWPVFKERIHSNICLLEYQTPLYDQPIPLSSSLFELKMLS